MPLFENEHSFIVPILASLFLVPIETWCQNKNIHRLKKQSNLSSSIDARGVLLNKLTWAYLEAEHDSCIYIARKAISYTMLHQGKEEQFIARLQLAEAYRTQNQPEVAFTELQEVQKEFGQLVIKKKYLPRWLLVRGRIAYDRSDFVTAEKCYRKGYSMNSVFPHTLQAEFCIGLADIERDKGHIKNEREYLLRAHDLAQKQKNSFLELISLNELGMNAAQSNLFERAQGYFDQSLRLAQKQQNLKAQSRAYLNIGSLFYYKGNWNAAVANYIKSAAIKERLNDEAGIAMIHNNIAAIYKEQKRYEKSLEYYRKTTDYYRKTDDSISLAETWINEAIVHISSKEHQAGIHLIKKALRLLKTRDLPDVVLVAYTNLAFAYTETKAHKDALHYLEIAKKMADDLNDRHSIVFIANLYGANYFFLKAYPEAIQHYTLSHELGKELGLLNEQKKALFGLYEAEQKIGNYQQALIWHEQYTRIADSLFNAENQQHLMKLEEQYDTKQKIQDIHNLHSRNKAISLKNKLTSNKLKLSLLSISLIMSGVGFLSLLYYQHTKRQKLLFVNTQERHKERVNQLMSSQEIELLEMAVSTQQNERRKLAKDIHDNLGSYLATLKYQHEAYQPEPGQNALIKHYETTSKLIAEACSELRSISHQMATGIDFQFSLIPSLKELVQRIETTHQFDLYFQYSPDDISLTRESASALYKMIQELLSNTLKHAGATRVELQINQHEEEITVLLEDNGRGFDPNTVSGGIGLANIRERLSQFQGKLEINSGFHNGTTIVLILPLIHDSL